MFAENLKNIGQWLYYLNFFSSMENKFQKFGKNMLSFVKNNNGKIYFDIWNNL